MSLDSSIRALNHRVAVDIANSLTDCTVSGLVNTVSHSMTVQVIVSTSYFFVMYREIKVKNDVCYEHPDNNLFSLLGYYTQLNCKKQEK